MIGEQSPSVAWRPGGGQHPTKPLAEGGSVGVIPDDRSPFDPPADDVVQGLGCVQTCEASMEEVYATRGRKLRPLFQMTIP